MKYLFCPRCGAEKLYRPTLAGRSFKCGCGTKSPVPRYVKQQPVTPPTEPAIPPTRPIVEPKVPTLSEVRRHQRVADECSRLLQLAEAELARCQQEVREKAAAQSELKQFKDQTYSQSVIGKFRWFLAIIGLAPGWVLADATIGTWGCIFFCPLSARAFLWLGDLMGFQKFRSTDCLLLAIEAGTNAESRHRQEQDEVRKHASLHSEALSKAELARTLYETETQRLDKIAAQKQRREERLARTPRPIELPSTSKINTSNVKTMGVGHEWVYACSFPSQMNEGQFPIKVGMTSRTDVLKRLDEQMTGTSMPEPASLLLLFKVENGMQAERALHKSLKNRHRHMDTAVGSEWFRTNPTELVELFLSLGHVETN